MISSVICSCIFSFFTYGSDANVVSGSTKINLQVADFPLLHNDWRPLSNYKNIIKNLSPKDIDGYSPYVRINRRGRDSLSEKHKKLQPMTYYNYPLPSILGSSNLLGYHVARYRDLKEIHQIRDTPKVDEFYFLVPPIEGMTQIRVDPHKTDIYQRGFSWNWPKINQSHSEILDSKKYSVNKILQPIHANEHLMHQSDTSQSIIKQRYTDLPVPLLVRDVPENHSNISLPANSMSKKYDGFNVFDKNLHEHSNFSIGKINMWRSKDISGVQQTFTDSEVSQSPELSRNNSLSNTTTEKYANANYIANDKSSKKIQLISSPTPISMNETPETISLKHYNERTGKKQLLKNNRKQMFPHQNNHSNHNNLTDNVLHTKKYGDQKIIQSNIITHTKINRNESSELLGKFTKNIYMPPKEIQKLKMENLETITPSNAQGSSIVPFKFAVNSRTSMKNCTKTDYKIIAHWDSVDARNHTNHTISYSSIHRVTEPTIQSEKKEDADVELKNMSDIVPAGVASNRYLELSKVTDESDRKLSPSNDSLPLKTASISFQSGSSGKRKTMGRNDSSSHSDYFQNHNSSLNKFSYNQTNPSESLFHLKQPLSIRNETKKSSRSTSSKDSIIHYKGIDEKYNNTPLKVSNTSLSEEIRFTNNVNIFNSSVNPILELKPDDYKNTTFQNSGNSKVVQNYTIKSQLTMNTKPYNLTLKVDKNYSLSPLENLFNLTEKKNSRNGTHAYHQLILEKRDGIMNKKLANITTVPKLRHNFRNRILKLHNGTRPRFSVKNHVSKVSYNTPTNSTLSLKYTSNRYKFLSKNLHEKISPIAINDNSSTSVPDSETDVKLYNMHQKKSSFGLLRNKSISPFETIRGNKTLRNIIENKSRSMNQSELHSNMIVRPYQISRKLTESNDTKITTKYMTLKKKTDSEKLMDGSHFFNGMNRIDAKNNRQNSSVYPSDAATLVSNSKSSIVGTGEKLVTHKNADEEDIFSRASQNVADLTDSASTLYDQPGMFKALSTPQISNSHDSMNHMIVNAPWDPPTLPIETFFRDMTIDT